MPQSFPKLFTLKEAAEILRLSPSSIHRRIDDGSLPTVKIGKRRFVPAAVINGIFSGFIDAKTGGAE